MSSGTGFYAGRGDVRSATSKLTATSYSVTVGAASLAANTSGGTSSFGSILSAPGAKMGTGLNVDVKNGVVDSGLLPDMYQQNYIPNVSTSAWFCGFGVGNNPAAVIVMW